MVQDGTPDLHRSIQVMSPQQFEEALHEWGRAEDEALRLEAEALRPGQPRERAAATNRQARESRMRADAMLADLAAAVTDAVSKGVPTARRTRGLSGTPS